MSLLSLPNEILLAIADNQDCEKDINAFARTSGRCYILLNPFLYAYNVREHQGSALHWAATQGIVRAAQESLQQGAEIESRDWETQNPPLILAAYYGHADMVTFLLAQGADPYAESGGRTQDAITSAVLRNKTAVAEILLDSGIDANRTDYRGSSLLHLAAESSPLSLKAVVRILIERGANLESRNELSQTPLQVACKSGSVEVARCLIESGANLNVRSESGSSLLHLAFSEVKTVELLVQKGADIEAKDEQGETPLHLACRDGWVETASFLLDHGADIESRSLDGSTPLMRGVLWESIICRELGPTSVTTLLLSRGANPRQGNDFDITPLHCATAKANSALFRLLLRYGADVEPKTRAGVTPLHKLASTGSLDSARQLLQRGADAQPRDEEGNTPLHMAAERNDVEFISLLLAAGADRLVRNNKGQFPIHVVSKAAHKSEERQREVMALLEVWSDN
ncbi:hypothetical protein DTO027I6_4830 [Penicillium roqueforti]|nr:hypothetical protein CBS147355_2853 [Penicillium roqueforti]KAI2703910.1 hypothetical protein CBS147372_2379 [Penicillium roqueforti]KAI2712721.1 hypothetical protein CBS147354_7908 [Penicillium roqueforti]KAI3157464.1 hypothetical protein CBS147317_5203 [Penicillium roqueforti]KAI3207059.1 hypothetical protein DTO027I6_4830 [Penicillium roqueforti]